MINEDLNMSGQFSPPHDNDGMIGGSGDRPMELADQESPYADQIQSNQPGMLLDPIAKSPSYEIEDASGFQMSDSQYQSDIQSTTGKPKTKTAYNIDLFSTGQEE